MLVDLMKRGGFVAVPPPASKVVPPPAALNLKVRVQELETEVSSLKALLLKERQKTATLQASEGSLKATISTLESKQGVLVEAMKKQHKLIFTMQSRIVGPGSPGGPVRRSSTSDLYNDVDLDEVQLCVSDSVFTSLDLWF